MCAVTGRTYTYSETRDAANYVGRSLLNMGLKKRDVVALVAPNYPETIISFLGTLDADLVVTTVNPFYTAGELIELCIVHIRITCCYVNQLKIYDRHRFLCLHPNESFSKS